MRATSSLLSLAGLLGLVLAAQPFKAAADDIDIFLGTSGGSAVAPNVVFLLDNGPNWSRQSQSWCSASDIATNTACSGNGKGLTQGQAEVEAILAVLAKQTNPLNVGFALLTDQGGGQGACPPGLCGAYLRYGVRDITQAANLTAVSNILNMVNANINSPNEKIQGMSHKDESAALYEVYKYFSGLAPHFGPPGSNGNADIVGSKGYRDATYGYSTPFGQGLTSGFAYNAAGTLYNAPDTGGGCGNNYVIYIANNANNVGSPGAQTYETTSAGAPILPNLALDTATNNNGWWTDEWVRFLYQNKISTYVLDAYNGQQNTDYSAELMQAASQGGGGYFAVSNIGAVTLDLAKILAEIQAVNSTFASASLPVNATNRSQSQNQVFIGSFRPDPDAKPRWMGNLKQYQLIESGTSIALGDALGSPAVNFSTGFLTDCAVSFWDADTTAATPPTPAAAYWYGFTETPLPKSACLTPPTPSNPSLPAGYTAPDPYSDWPDGPTVEKGGVAEVIRRGNNPGTASTSTTYSPTWTVNRTVKTLSGTNTITDFSAASSGLSSTLVAWVLGNDNHGTALPNNTEKPGNANTNTRPSLHGDVIHSRPQPITYDSSATGVTVFYGANDGMLRSVDAATGKENWAFVAPEFFGKFQRLYDNSPLVNYPTMSSGITPTPTAKDYFFDGLIGVYQNADNSDIWIYPSMRRGGRTIYALDVTTQNAVPAFKWKFGCPHAADDSNCVGDTGVTSIGQTWSAPSPALVKGYEGASTPIMVVGGGYDSCEDANSTAPACASAKGRIVYVLDANDGSVLRTFTTTRSVAADPALMTVHFDGTVDYAYLADTGGNIYRIDFIDTSGNALSKDHWTMHRVAYTNGGGRKFLFPVAEFPAFGGKAAYVAVGSGDREHPLQSEYPYTTPVTNRFYVFIDDLTTASRTINLDDTSTSDTYYMRDYTNNNCSTTATCSALNLVFTQPTAAVPEVQVGWFINLTAGTGEQAVTSAVIAGGAVAFSTNRPIPQAAGTCSTALGEARGYLVNLINGSGEIGTTQSIGGDRSTVLPGGGLPPSPVLVTTDVNGKLKTVIIGAAQKSGGASSAISPQQVVPPINAKRRVLYWKSSGDNR